MQCITSHHITLRYITLYDTTLRNTTIHCMTCTCKFTFALTFTFTFAFTSTCGINLLCKFISRRAALRVETRIIESGHLRPVAASCISLERPRAPLYAHVRTCGHFQPLTRLEFKAPTFGHLRPFAWNLLVRPVAANGCEWLRVAARLPLARNKVLKSWEKKRVLAGKLFFSKFGGWIVIGFRVPRTIKIIFEIVDHPCTGKIFGRSSNDGRMWANWTSMMVQC